jgi:hypothetical protein
MVRDHRFPKVPVPSGHEFRLSTPFLFLALNLKIVPTNRNERVLRFTIQISDIETLSLR